MPGPLGVQRMSMSSLVSRSPFSRSFCFRTKEPEPPRRVSTLMGGQGCLAAINWLYSSLNEMEMRLPDRGGIEPGKNGGFFPGLEGQPTPQPCPLFCCPLKAHPAQEPHGHPAKGGLSSSVPSSAGPRRPAWGTPWPWVCLPGERGSGVSHV